MWAGRNDAFPASKALTGRRASWPPMRAPQLLVLVGVLAVVGAGCLGAGDPAGDADPPPPGDNETRLEVHGPLTDDAVGREPAVLRTGPGTLFVAAGAERTENFDAPLVWRSQDGGETFERLDVGQPQDGAGGNTDVDLAVGPEGTLYLAAMAYTPSPGDVFVGASAAITVASSTDGGETWSWTTPVQGPAVDRPWIETTPDGTAHLVWNDERGVHHATSSDQGASWSEGPLVHDAGGDGALVASSDLLAVRIVPPSSHGYRWEEGADGVAVSRDGGESWRFHELPGDRDWHGSYADVLENRGIDRLWEPLALGAEGTLYATWKEGSTVVAARSTDAARSWTLEPVAEDRPGLSFPWLDAGGPPGELAVTWFEEPNGSQAAKLAEVSWGAKRLDARLHTLSNATNGTWGEYLDVDVRPDGTAWTAVPVDDGQGPLLRFAETRHPAG